MSAHVLHLHTYFSFPFSIDQNAVMEDHPRIWTQRDQWFEKLDLWVTEHASGEHALPSNLYRWKRTPHTRFDLQSPSYQDMVFFHPFIRRAFFDTASSGGDHDPLVHSYSMHAPAGSRLFFSAEDRSGYSAEVEVTSIQLLIFGNGISILTLGVEARDIEFGHALWANEMIRRIYPTSERQFESGRIPSRMSLEQRSGGEMIDGGPAKRVVLAEETFSQSRLIGLRPQLSAILLWLLYFASYPQQEFEAVLDERMIVNTFVKLDIDRFPPAYETSEEYEGALSRLLYVDRDGLGHRYDTQFTREQLRHQLYRRWQHEGRLHGVNSYSSATLILASANREGADAAAYRMFTTKSHLIALIALFYRATLLDFAKESALVSRELFPIFSGKVVRHSHIQFASKLMADFHYFNNYWFFDELTTKDEELEQFAMFRKAYRIDELKDSLGDQIDRLAGYIDRLYALRNSDAVNRLAMLSVILGVGAFITGFYGMNISHLTTLLQNNVISLVSLICTTALTIASLCFVVYIVGSNWVDYRASLLPHRYRKSLRPNSLRRLDESTPTDLPGSEQPVATSGTYVQTVDRSRV